MRSTKDTMRAVAESDATAPRRIQQSAPASKDFDQLVARLRDDKNLNRPLFDKENGPTALQQAAISGPVLLLKALIEAGAAIDFTTDNGSSALHLAAFFCNIDTAKCLLDSGASTEIKDCDDYTPLDMIALGVIVRGKIKTTAPKVSVRELVKLFLEKEIDPYSTIKISLREIVQLNSRAKISTEEKIIVIKLIEIVTTILGAKTTDLRRSPEEDSELLILGNGTCNTNLERLIKVGLQVDEKPAIEEGTAKTIEKGKKAKDGKKKKGKAPAGAGSSAEEKLPEEELPEEDLKEDTKAPSEVLELPKDETPPSTIFISRIRECLEDRSHKECFDSALIDALPLQLKTLIEQFKSSAIVEQCMMIGSAVYGNRRRPNDLDFYIVVQDGSLIDGAAAKHFFDSIPPELHANLNKERSEFLVWKICIGSAEKTLVEITFSESKDYHANPSWTVTPEAKYFDLRTSTIKFHPSLISHDRAKDYFSCPQKAGSEPPFVVNMGARNLTLRAVYASLPHGLPKLAHPDAFALGIGLSKKMDGLFYIEERDRFLYLVTNAIPQFKKRHCMTARDEVVFDYEIAQILKTLPLSKLPEVKSAIAGAEKEFYADAPSASPFPASKSTSASKASIVTRY